MVTQRERETNHCPETGWGGSATTRAASAASGWPRSASDRLTHGPRCATAWPPTSTTNTRSGPAASTGRRRRNEHERRLQIWLVDRFRELVDPADAIILALENGEDRKPETLALLDRLGVLDGTPDLAIVYYAGQILWVEVKLAATLKHRRTGLSPAQKELHAQLRGLGHSVHEVRSGREFWALLKWARIPFRPPPPKQLSLFGQARKLDCEM
jgi:hypothetical protein